VTTRDRLWTARTGFFVLYSDFKEHLATNGRPTRESTTVEAVVPSDRIIDSIRNRTCR